MIAIVGIAMILLGVLWRDLSGISARDARRRFSERWDALFQMTPPTTPLGDLSEMAAIIGDPDTPPAMLDVIAREIAANEWVPSEPLLDQLRRWANSQLVAERALLYSDQLLSSEHLPSSEQQLSNEHSSALDEGDMK